MVVDILENKSELIFRIMEEFILEVESSSVSLLLTLIWGIDRLSVSGFGDFM